VLLVLLLLEVSIHVDFVGPKHVAGKAAGASVHMLFERFVPRRGFRIMESQVSNPALWDRDGLWNANVIEHVAKGLGSS
jgi:hypothetical protein